MRIRIGINVTCLVLALLAVELSPKLSTVLSTVGSFLPLARADAEHPPGRDKPLEVGQEAPGFSLPSTMGENVSLTHYRGKKTVILFFFPRAFAPADQREVEGFRDDIAFYERRGAALVGISVDDPKTNKSFAMKMNLPFPLLSDPGAAVSRDYGVMGWIMAKRVTFIIGLDGIVKQVFPEIDVENHSREVLRAIGETSSALNASHSRKSKR